eukprot:5174707-Prorocentrum_lima.AAC.1
MPTRPSATNTNSSANNVALLVELGFPDLTYCGAQQRSSAPRMMGTERQCIPYSGCAGIVALPESVR